MIVYLITNKINGMRYVGQTTKSLVSRWSAHKSKRSCCTFLKHALSKYGSENFQIKILSRCNTIEEMNHREQYYIKLFKTLSPCGYNLTTGGEGRLVSEETRARMSSSQKGIKKPCSVEHAKKLGLARLGTKQSSQQKAKRAASMMKPIEVPELGVVFPGFDVAWNTLNAYPNAITFVLNGKRSHWRGLTFKHANKKNINSHTLESQNKIFRFLRGK